MTYKDTGMVRIPKIEPGDIATSTQLLPRQKLSDKISKMEKTIENNKKKKDNKQ